MLMFVSIVLCSCSNSKFDDAVSIIGSLPVFFDQDKIEQTASYEDGKLIISFPFESTSKWDNVIGDGWIPQVFIRELFENNIAAYTLGSVLKTKEGVSPIEDFLSIMDEKNAKFEIKYGNKSVLFSTDEIRELLNDDIQKDIAAPYFAIQMEKFADYYNEELQASGLYLTSAAIEHDTLYININCKKNIDLRRINPVTIDAILTYPAIPMHCYLNKLCLAFRYHKIDKENQLTTNKIFEGDIVMPVPSEKLEKTWEKMQQEKK